MSAAITIKPPHSPLNTLFMPWTRKEYARDVLHCIDRLNIPRPDFEVVFYIDTDEKELHDILNAWAILQLQMGWNGITIVKSGNPQPETYSPLPRRARIVQMKEDSKQYIHATQFVFGLEDDTIFPANAYARLKDIFDKREGTGFAQGVQQGRWGLNVIGAWQVDNLTEPTTMSTLPMEDTGIAAIDGGGFFCYLTYAELYKAHTYYWHDECFGPDATYGLELRRNGYDCWTDYGLVCDHLTTEGKLVPYPRTISVATWRKQGSRWVRDEVPGEYTENNKEVS